MWTIQRIPIGRRLSLGRRRCSSSSDQPHQTNLSAASSLRTLLDRRIVGHENTKECILLGLAASEHVFVQGEPGTAKTYAAELAAQLANLSTYSVQFHRDTRLQDLIGDSIIVRQTCPSTSHEIVRQSVDRGGLLTCEVAVLDDLTRAPGEALNVLLRILNERTFEDQELPLRCAIATANAPRDDMYVEPLDPANLDRFALQVQSDSLILGNDWTSVHQVVDMYQENTTTTSTQDDNQLAQAAKAVGSIDVNSVVLGDDMKECFILFLQWLSNHEAVTPRNSLLTDRTFLVKAPRILRAQAALQGRQHVEVQDMLALRHMTTFRVPAAVHQQVCELLTLLAQTSPNDDNEDDNDDDNDGTKQGGNHKMAGYLKHVIQQFQEGGPRIQGPRGAGNSSGDSKMNIQSDEESDEKTTTESADASTSKAKDKKKVTHDNDAIDHDLLADIGGTSVLHATVLSFVATSKTLKERTIRPLRRLWGAAQGPQIKLNLHSTAVSGAETVMAVLHGRTRRSRAPSTLQQQSLSTVGQPRERGRLPSMGDPNLFQDGDPADISSWIISPTSSLPRGLLRHPKRRGGSIALARDISDSMWGPKAALASATTQAAINLARQRGMRFGYCEFAGTPKLYYQRPPDHVREQPCHADDDAHASRYFQEALLDWGVAMTNQLGGLFGLEPSNNSNSQVSSSGHFFGVDYALCERRARQLETDGYTNLQDMLRQLLERFNVSGLPPHERHLLIITDGSPTTGSATCIDEAMLAKNLGVAIHPVFVVDDSEDWHGGGSSYPDVLTNLAEMTNGVRFLAKHEVTLDEQAEVDNNEYAHLVQVKVELA
ncbi:ATPase RavA [Seminavis robusta]|uniref:ATPase RavA n=1 Tax=Seminavis robusta TaxID=568900 RepID=A0A9N8E3H8_9STRA|nr:ATPase RavA [Seminavis robusta]|eukprot:Sro580_g170110.1 ATPase RavA (828) ;mRNA; r:14311-16794